MIALRTRSQLILLLLITFNAAAQNKGNGRKPAPPDYTIQLDVVSSGFDGISCWFHPRAGILPGSTPTVVLTMQKWIVKRSDVFLPLWGTYTTDMGKTWSKISEHAGSLGRRTEPDQVEAGISDFTPKWHAQSGKLLGTGHTVRYRDNHLIRNGSRQTIYSIYDPESHSWSPWQTLKMPDDPKFYSSGAGSTQRVDLPNGDILLPVYFKTKESNEYSSAVVRCAFNGKQLVYREHGSELTLPTGRGFVEPSITSFDGRYFLTLRNDNAGYVTVSNDGQHFDPPKEWLFDDGESLGNYNTQQHWVTHSDGLFLVYTRKAKDNENVVRHRAPLFIAQVDPEKLVIIRKTEKILVPNKGAQLGNFGVVNLNKNETWVTTSEGMSQGGEYGADGRVYAARIIWSTPNRNID